MSDESRGWLRGVLVDLAEQAGAVDPQRLAAQLALLYDGAVVTGRMDRDPSAADSARAAAAAVLSVEIPG